MCILLITGCHGNSSIAVLLESFSLFYNEDDSCLDYGVIKDFVLVWSKFDPKASVIHHTLSCVVVILI